MPALTAIAFVLVLCGVLLVVSGVHGVRKRKPMRVGTRGGPGALMVAIGVLLGSLAANLHTYARFNAEQPVATVALQKLGEQRFRAHVTLPAAERSARFELRGDQWQIDARVLRWRGLAILAGLDSRFRLERLSGRFSDTSQASRTLPSVHDLSGEQGVDFWGMARRYGEWLPLVDATYGSGAYVPMADGSRWQVSIGRDGLIIRPDNPAAAQALARW